MWRRFAKAVHELQRTFAEGGGTYRPDLHYMRGPGPKWHAKYGSLSPKMMPTAHTQRSSMRGHAEPRA